MFLKKVLKIKKRFQSFSRFNRITSKINFFNTPNNWNEYSNYRNVLKIKTAMLKSPSIIDQIHKSVDRGEFDNAVELIEIAKSRQIIFTESTYDKIVRTFANLNDLENLFKYFNLMLDQNFIPCVGTIIAAFKSYWNNNELESSKDAYLLFNKLKMIKRLKSEDFKEEEDEDEFDGNFPSITAQINTESPLLPFQVYNSMISICIQAKMFQEAEDLIIELKKNGIANNIRTFMQKINLFYYKYNSLEIGLKKVKKYSNFFEAEEEKTEIYISFIKFCCQTKNTKDAMKVLKIIEGENKLKNYENAYSFIISSLIAENKRERVERMLEKLCTRFSENDKDLDVVCNLITTFFASQKHSYAKDFYFIACDFLNSERGKKTGSNILKSSKFYNTILKSVFAVCDYETADKVWEDFLSSSVPFDSEISITFLKGYGIKEGNLDKVNKCFKIIKKNSPLLSNSIYKYLAKIYQKKGKHEKASDYALKALLTEKQNDSSATSVLVETKIAKNDLDSAVKLFNKLMRKGTMPEKSVFKSLITSLALKNNFKLAFYYFRLLTVIYKQKPSIVLCDSILSCCPINLMDPLYK